MILKTADNNSIEKIKALYKRAFPLNERKPFHVIENNAGKGKSEILALYDDRFLGLVITINYKDMVLIDYFAIEDSERGNGIGSKALKLIAERFPEKRVFLEIELPDENADNNVQRLRRKDFYLRNGLKETGIHVNVYHTDMELLSFTSPITFDEYVELYKDAMGETWLKHFGRPKLI